METTVKLHALNFGNTRTYLMAALFVAGNIALPQLCHMASLGGATWLPIYFFTLIGAYKYGRNVGLLTAVLSPLVNSLLFGMPMPVLLPSILVKSCLLALAAGWAARRAGKVSLLALAGVVLFYQTGGSLVEWAVTGSFATAVQDFRNGIPGLLLQVFGGYALLRAIARK